MEERNVFAINGFIGLLVFFLLLVLGVLTFVAEQFVTGIVLVVVSFLMSSGMFIVQPNQASTVTYFGKYMGTVREPGFWYTLPFSSRRIVSLRVRNFNSKQLKVNDVDGNPIEIAAVVVFRVVDSAKALFDVEHYEQFVEIQSETALRHITTYYPYDNYETDGLSLRGNSDEVAAELKNDLQTRLAVAGVEVVEARLTHLAYAPEIAHAMLQRQQAKAILAAREKIVEGAVGMVQMAIEKLKQDGVVELDEERKAAMANNLLVAIVSDTQPVVNTGSIY